MSNFEYIIPQNNNLNDFLKNAYISSCYTDVEVIKPGNVSIFSPHHDTTADDFKKSAELSSNYLISTESLGKRIFYAVEKNIKIVKKNTNLGIILLCAPLIYAIQNNSLSLRRIDIQNAINHISDDDGQYIFKAIAVASPGGLGKSDYYDVNETLDNDQDMKFLDVMRHSSSYDRISYQYTSYFEDIFDFIVPCIDYHLKTRDSYANALPLVFLEILSKLPDTHITRKLGNKIAKKTSNEANDLLKILVKDDSQERGRKLLEKLDYKYKKNRINPGTTADLLVAGLMIHKIFKSE
mgnify:FL=1